MLEKAVAPYPDLVQLHIGDVTEESWSADAPIEVAFIDVCRSKNLNAHVAKEFLPALIPGGSTLIYREFFCDRLSLAQGDDGPPEGLLQLGRPGPGRARSTAPSRQVPADVAAYDPFHGGERTTSASPCTTRSSSRASTAGYEVRMRPVAGRHADAAQGAQRRRAGHPVEELEAEYADVLEHEAFGHGRAVPVRACAAAGVLSNTFTVQATTVARLVPDVLGSRFVKELDVVETADALRRTEVAPGMLSYLERSLIQRPRDQDVAR